MHEQVVEPDVDELGPVDGVEPAPARRSPTSSAISRYRGSRLGFGACRRFTSWYPVATHDDPVRAVAEVEHERGVKVDEARPFRLVVGGHGEWFERPRPSATALPALYASSWPRR